MADWGDMIYKQWEKMFSRSMQQLVQNQNFLSQMGKVMETSNLFKLTVDKSLQKGLESMQIPTRKDLDEAMGAVRKLEVSSARIEQRLSALEEKLDAVLSTVAVLAALEEKKRMSRIASEKQPSPRKAAAKKTTTKKGTSK